MQDRRGFTLVELMIVIAIIAIIAAIAIPNLIEARKGANESAAIGALRTILTAQQIFREQDKDHNNTLDYASQLSQLAAANLIDPVLSTGTKQGYVFALVTGFSDYRWQWAGQAAPQFPGRTGDRYFHVDYDGLISYSSNGVPIPAMGQGVPIGQ